MKVSEIMSTPVYTCAPTAKLIDAAQIMWDRDCGAIVVVDAGERPIGVITDRDICMAGFLQGSRLSDLTVDGSMARKVATCSPDATLREAADMMRREQVRRLPVVGDDGRLTGIVSVPDLARAVARKGRKGLTLSEFVHTVAGICEPSTDDI